MGPLANVTQEGFAPAAFHSYPSTLDIDGYVCDYGSGFYGYAVNSSTYIYHHPEFDWVAFSGNIRKEGDWVYTEVTTAGKNRVFLAPESLMLKSVDGKIKQVGYNPTTREVELLLEGNTLLDIEVSEDRQVLFPSEIVTDERGYRVIKPVKRKEYTLRLTIE
jgi:hypothetical protein